MDQSAGQYRGVLGWAVDRMIHRAVRKGFHTVHWRPPENDLPRPSILVVNHHGWHDGYLMYIVARRLRIRVVDWIQEYDAFPLFGRVGGMPFPAGDPARRVATVRKTVRAMKSDHTSLILFAEGELHRPDSLLPFGRSLAYVVSKVPEVTVIPVAIRYELALHQRPEAFIEFGAPVAHGDRLAERTRLEIAAMLDRLKARTLLEPQTFQTLIAGTPDVNEKWRLKKRDGR